MSLAWKKQCLHIIQVYKDRWKEEYKITTTFFVFNVEEWITLVYTVERCVTSRRFYTYSGQTHIELVREQIVRMKCVHW